MGGFRRPVRPPLDLEAHVLSSVPADALQPAVRGLLGLRANEELLVVETGYNHQIEQPESEVAIYRCEELRILDDELFHAVQARLAEFKLGPRGPHKQQEVPPLGLGN